MKVYFLSFVGGSQDGAVIVRAESLGAAIQRTRELKLNPGGEVLGAEWPEDPAVVSDVESRFGGFDKFIPRATLDAMPGMRRVRTGGGAGGMLN